LGGIKKKTKKVDSAVTAQYLPERGGKIGGFSFAEEGIGEKIPGETGFHTFKKGNALICEG